MRRGGGGGEERLREVEERYVKLRELVEGILETQAILKAYVGLEKVIPLGIEERLEKQAVGGLAYREFDEEDYRIWKIIDEMDRLMGILREEIVLSEEIYERILSKREEIERIPYLIPTRGWIVSGFGFRIDPFTYVKRFHKGVDIVTYMGAPVYATAKGRVLDVGRDPELGLYIKLDHGNGISTVYGHLHSVIVEKFENVERGEVIGYVGISGRATGPHLHYEIHVKGNPVNPLQYIVPEFSVVR